MTGLSNFFIAYLFSFIGSIPPGTINLTVIQLGLEHRIQLALRFALAATVVEYPYAWVALKFQRLITSSPIITENLHLVAAVVMTTLGVITLWPGKRNPSGIRVRLSNSGYRRGLIVGILNPLAIPYWIAVTTYLKGHGWIELSSPGRVHAYLLGVFLGALSIMIILAYVSKKALTLFSEFPQLKRVPALLLLTLGLYSFVQYLFGNNS